MWQTFLTKIESTFYFIYKYLLKSIPYLHVVTFFETRIALLSDYLKIKIKKKHQKAQTRLRTNY